MIDPPLRIAVVDDHPLVCDGIRGHLTSWPFGDVVLTAGNGEEYERACAAHGPIHIAIVDLSMPKRDGFETIAWIGENQPGTMSIAITFDPRPEVVERVMKLGARGIVDKTSSGEEIRRALEHVHQTGFYHNELVRRYLMAPVVKPRPDNVKVLKSLTRMELDLLRHLSDLDNPTYEEIAHRMGRSVNTIHTHRRNLFVKFGMDSRQGLFRLVKDWKLFDEWT